MLLIKELLDEAHKLYPNFSSFLKPPATERQLESLRVNHHGIEIDPLLIEFYSITNGIKGGLLLGSCLSDIDRCIYYQKKSNEGVFSIPHNPELCKGEFYSKKRVMFMDDFSGSEYFLDYDPAEKGSIGQVICIFRDIPETIYNVAPSLSDFIKAIIEEFRAKRVRLVPEEDNWLYFDKMSFSYDYVFKQSSKLSKITKKINENLIQLLDENWKNALFYFCRTKGLNWEEGEILNETNGNLIIKEILVEHESMMDNFYIIENFPKIQSLFLKTLIRLDESHWKQVQKLKLNQLYVRSEINSVEPIVEIKTLTWLHLEHVAATSIDSFVELKHLVELQLSFKTTFPNLSFLREMKNLQKLNLEFDEVHTLSKDEMKSISLCAKLNSLNFRNVSFENT